MISIFFLAAFGAVIGWVAAILQDQTALVATLRQVVLGAIGGLVGGFGGALLSPADQAGTSSTTAIMFAVFGATALIGLAGLAQQMRSGE